MIIAVSNRLHRGLFVTFLTAKVSPFCKQVALALRFLSSFPLEVERMGGKFDNVA
jgi:hypothetical protein